MLNEKRILDELLEVVEQRDSLVAMLEEDRLRYVPVSSFTARLKLKQ